ncbi:hypothetical protein MHI37_06975 [Paenibacillus sp. FSL H8-0548]|uniref:hypothetical protein n=1 Tax=Paenibacillus sp. FSL H8-0548 TaxID=1920422 RepID=UPI00117E8F37|nr:hypothetical protein [Paenibacillus sp. FSL H8-0548]
MYTPLETKHEKLMRDLDKLKDDLEKSKEGSNSQFQIAFAEEKQVEWHEMMGRVVAFGQCIRGINGILPKEEEPT